MTHATMELANDGDRTHLVRRKILLLACTLAIVAGSVALLAWRAAVWRERGTTGVMYNASTRPSIQEKLPALIRKNTTSRVVMVVPGSEGERAGIRAGDVVVAVNGVPALELSQPDAVVPLHGEVVYRVAREGTELTFTTRRGAPLDLPGMRFGMWSSLFTAFVFLAISTLVFWTKPRSERAMVFYFMCASATVVFVLYAIYEIEAIGTGVQPVGVSPAFWLTWTVYTLIAVLMACLLVHLSLVFPRERPVVARNPKLRGWIYATGFAGLYLPGSTIAAAILADGPLAPLAGAAMLALALLAIAWGWRRARPTSLRAFVATHPLLVPAAGALTFGAFGTAIDSMPKGYGMLFGIAMVLAIALYFLVVLAVFSVGTCVCLYRGYRDADVEEKRQVRWPLWGTILSIASVTVATLVLVLWSVSTDAPAKSAHLAQYAGATIKLLYLIIPVSFAFGILRYRVMDIDVIIRKTFVYGAATGIVVVAYLALVGGAGALLMQASGVTSQLTTIAGTLAIAALFIPVRNRVQRLVDRRFFRTRHDYPRALDAIGDAAASDGDLRGALRSIAASLQQALQNRSVTIFAREEGAALLMPAASIGVPREVFEKVRLAPRRAWAEPEPPVVPLADAELADGERAKYRKLGTAMLVPVRHDGETIGVVTLGPKLSSEPWGEEDAEFLAAAARQIAVALEASRARVDDSELRGAREIQEALLPKSITQLPGFSIAGVWLPARTMGGDYFDVLPLGPDRAGVCIADVVGKGMSAAILMSGLQASVRALAPEASSTAELVTKVRRLVAGNLSGGRFVTFFYGEIDGPGRRFRYSNAGHNPPILVRAAGGEARALHEGGHAIARLFAASPIEAGEVELAPGDAVVLYTDGVTEAANGDGEQFGEERLEQLVRENLALDASGIEEAILAALHAWGDGEAQDDVTLLVVKTE